MQAAAVTAVPAATAAARAAAPTGGDREQALSVARQFEQVFVQMMVSTMRASAEIGGEDGGMFGQGPGADTYAEWFDGNLARHLAQGDRIGVAKVLMREFERWRQIPPPPPADAGGALLRTRMNAIPGGIDVAA